MGRMEMEIMLTVFIERALKRCEESRERRFLCFGGG
jgi:hypothetical protein